jgi:SAM-dependent methyltransferase
MSAESSKTQSLRSKEFIDKYFGGNVIDIGAGNDPVVNHAEVFDLIHGDAQEILTYREKSSYDCVNSSHCLEHMKDVPAALSQWWGLVKPGGYLVTVVPHEDLYEQGVWPSIFNYDHKATFRINKENTWSPVSYDVHSLFNSLPNAIFISAEVQDKDYDYSLSGKKLGQFSIKIYKWRGSKNKIKKFISDVLYNFLYINFWTKDKNNTGIPVDQTLNDAMAQIQIVLQKK